jgi:sugar lactone lactonase YvrE
LWAVVCLTSCSSDPECRAATGVICTVAGTGEYGFNRDGLDARKSDLYLVSAARRGPDERIYVMDFNNQRLRVIDAQGAMQTVIGDGFHAVAAIDRLATDSPLENPIDFDFLSDGRLVFVSYHDPRVILWDDDKTLRSLAGTGEIGTGGSDGDGGPALEASFIQLDGIAIDDDDTIYVSDSLAHRVRRIRDGAVATVAGSGEGVYVGTGVAVDVALQWPTALTLDTAGNLLIADTGNHVVRRLATDGSLSTIVGTGEKGDAGDGGDALSAQLNQPNGLAITEDGTLYIADRGNFRLRRVSAAGTIETIAGTGEEGSFGDGVSALGATFGYLARVALDGDGLLIADQSSSLVRRLTLE